MTDRGELHRDRKRHLRDGAAFLGSLGQLPPARPPLRRAVRRPSARLGGVNPVSPSSGPSGPAGTDGQHTASGTPITEPRSDITTNFY